MKEKNIVLTTIPSTPSNNDHPEFLQLGLYMLKAYAMKYCQYERAKDMIIDVIKPDNMIFTAGNHLFPDLNNTSLFKQALRLLKKDPLIIGLSCFMWNIDLILNLTKLIKTMNPNVVVVLGGPEVSSNPESILKANRSIDIIVRDEGEATLAEIIDFIYCGKQKLSDIRGISYRFKDRIFRNPDREPLDLSTIPSPYVYGLIDLNKNLKFGIETSRGCPFHCAYCTFSIRVFSKLRFFPMKYVKEEINYIQHHNAKYLWINDDNFNIHTPRAIKILEYIAKFKKRYKLITLFINASFWKIDQKLIHLLKKNNIVANIGVQSMNEATLSIIGRNNNRKILEENIEQLNKEKVNYALQFIIGLPGETSDSFNDAINWAARLGPPSIQIGLLMVFKDTRLFTDAKKLGLKFDKKLPYYIKETKEQKKKEIIEAHRIIKHIDILYSQGLLRNTIKLFLQKHNLNFIDIINEWKKMTMIGSRDKARLSMVQKKFVKLIMDKYKINITKPKLEKLLKRDWNYYLRLKNYIPT